METTTRSHCLYMAKLAQHAGRYDDMLKFMESLVTRFISAGGSPLTPDELSLLFSACKNQTGSLRDALQAMPPKDAESGNAAMAGNCRSKAESELFELCERILLLLDSHLMPSASSSESRVFYLKMKGDCHRYLAECKNGRETKRAAVEAAMAAYKLAEEIAKAELAPTHPMRLSLMLNFAVFYHDILREPEFACGMAREAFEEAAAQPSRYKSREGTASAAHIMQLLREIMPFGFQICNLIRTVLGSFVLLILLF